MDKRISLITGASSGIGYELAKCAAADDYHLVICSNEYQIHEVAHRLRSTGVTVEAVEANLGSTTGIDTLLARLAGRDVEQLIANAGIGLGEAFLDQDLEAVTHVIDTNITGTLQLVQQVGHRMREKKDGRILITGSLVGSIPGSFHAIYNATKAFLNSFSYALAEELSESGVSVTCLMPGPTDTLAFERAGLSDSKIGKFPLKDDPTTVAAQGYQAMLDGRHGIVGGNLMNKVEMIFADLIPKSVLAEMHRIVAKTS